MKPILIDEYTAVDSRGELHHVQVMQHISTGGAFIGDDSRAGEETHTLKLVVDGNHVAEPNPLDPDSVLVPRFGKLIRQF